MKYSRICSKISYKTEREAWEHVIEHRRKKLSWTMPYKCTCKRYHLTGKWFDPDKVPAWVKQEAAQESKKRKIKDQTLSLTEQKQILAKLNNKPCPILKQKIVESASRMTLALTGIFKITNRDTI